jgi:hypothetical protein
LHVRHEVWIVVVGHHNGASTLNSAHNAGHARRGTNLENILIADQLVRSFFDIVGTRSPSIP